MICEECDSKMELVDSHRSYESSMEYTVVKYYNCNQCGNKYSEEIK